MVPECTISSERSNSEQLRVRISYRPHPMKVLALTPGPRFVSPGQRYRIEQWEPLLQAEGIALTHAPFMENGLSSVLYQPGSLFEKAAEVTAAFWRQLSTISESHHFDLVYIFREAAIIGPAFIERRIASGGTPIVFDFDDAVFLRYRSASNGYLSYLKFPGKTATICRRAQHVMAGNRYLADYAARLNDAVTVIPTTIDTEIYRPELHRPRAGAPVTIGWTGSHSTRRHLVRLVPALAELARTHPFRLVVIGAQALDVPGAEVVSRHWTAKTEVEDLSDIDIGLMPLPDEPWTRGKCGLKALQYMGLGIPAVVSPVGVNTEIVAHGENGLVANSDAAWIDHLKTLMHDSELRRRLGAEARTTVETRYSARVVAPKVAEIFRRAKA